MSKINKPTSKRINYSLWELIKHREQSIVGIFESAGLVELIDPKAPKSFDNMVLTDLGKGNFSEVPIITDAYIDRYKSIFPNRNGNRSAIRTRLTVLLTENSELTLDTILKLAEKYVKREEYPRSALYYLNKNVVGSGEVSDLLSDWENETSDLIEPQKRGYSSGRSDL